MQNKLLLLAFISCTALADEAEFKTSTRILSIPQVKFDNSFLYDAKLKLTPEGLFSIVSYSETNQNQTVEDSTLLINGSGKVTRIFPDDLEGSRHQKFIIELSSGKTLLISHNIDIAPRINLLEKGDTVSFYGEYVWNSKGGLVHWTHRDPKGHHKDGWLKHNNTIYQ